MARNPTIEHVKRLVHRHGIAAPPAVLPLVAEIRTHGILPLQPCKPAIAYALGCIMIEWTFGVPYPLVPTFHQFLVEKETFIRDNVEKVPGARYLGTYWSASGGQYHYRTFWSYDGEDTITALNKVIKNSDNLRREISTLRSYWATDPSRKELKYQPASVITADYLQEYSEEEPIVGMGLDRGPAKARKRPRNKK